jgi:ABC-type sugar transport system ATPase subunit
MTFHKVKQFGKGSLHIILSRQDFYEVGDDVEVVKTGSLLKSKEMENWIREVVRAELQGRKLNISYEEKNAVENQVREIKMPELDEDL